MLPTYPETGMQTTLPQSHVLPALPHIRAMKPYVPGLQPQESGWTKLNTNENPYPPSPAVQAAIQRELCHLRLYPAPDSRPLRQALAAHHGVGEDWVIAGNGSDDTLNMLMRGYCDDTRQAGWTNPSYSLYPILLQIQHCPLVDVPFDRGMALPTAAIIHSGTDLFFLTSPNAPTGVAFPNRQIEAVLQQYSGLLVVDEAYADFARESAVDLLPRYPNLIVVRTFSKSYSLAGMRVGYALAHPEIVQILDRVRDSYNLDRLAQAAALAALQDNTYHRQCLDRILATRARTLAYFQRRGWFHYHSQTNFVFVEPQSKQGATGPSVAAALYDYLYARKILIRYFAQHPFCASFLRISIGTEDEMDRVFNALDDWDGESCSGNRPGPAGRS